MISKIPKRCDPSDPNDYRPTTLMPVISRIFEMAIDQLRLFLEREGLLSNRQ